MALLAGGGAVAFLPFIVFFGFMAGCASQPAQSSEAAKNQQTATGVKIAPEAGVPKTPSVEYIRFSRSKTR